jgi:YbbR domain-containing protein
MARRTTNLRFGVLAVFIAMALWLMAHGTSDIDIPVDIPVAFEGLPENLVITDQSADVVNIRVLGSRAVLRNVSPSKMKYVLDVSGGKRGPAVYEVNVSGIELPRGARIVSRSPAAIEIKFERRGRKQVRVRADLEGEPAEGFVVAGVEIDPPRVRLEGARSDVLRLSEVVTETIDVAGLAESQERQVGLSLGGGHVWMEENRPVTVRIQVEPAPEPEAEAEQGKG